MTAHASEEMAEDGHDIIDMESTVLHGLSHVLGVMIREAQHT